MRHKIARAVAVAGVVQFFFTIGAVVWVSAQSQEVFNAIVQQRVASAEGRVAALEKRLEDLDAGSRLRLLESDMWEVKWLGRTVAGLLATQLVAGGLRYHRKPESEDA